MNHIHIFQLTIIFLFTQFVTLSPLGTQKINNNLLDVNLNLQPLPTYFQLNSFTGWLIGYKDATEQPKNQLNWLDIALKTNNQINNLPITPSWSVTGDQVEERLGFSVASAGDVNGDGYSDLIVGAYQHSNGQIEEGRAYVYYGSGNGLGASPSWIGEINQAGAWFGYSISGAGDVNNDGYSDVIVGAPLFDDVDVDDGRVYVFYGSSSGLSTTPSWFATGDRANEQFGLSVSKAGDVNGDVFSDIIVGTNHYSNGQADEGGAFVFYGSGSGVVTSPAWVFESNQAGSWFGWPVNTAGDVNADGYSDVIIGAVKFDNKGRAFVFYGSSTGLATSPSWSAGSTQIESRFGYGADNAGDVNGDGYSDVIISAVWYDHPEVDEGMAFIYNGSASGLSLTPSWAVESNQVGAWFGWSAASTGDIDKDGYSDVVVGSPNYDHGQLDEGMAFGYFGTATGPGVVPNWASEGDQVGASYGWSSDSAGDVNGDGFSDVAIGANLFDNVQNNPSLLNAGRAYVFYGLPIPRNFSQVIPLIFK